VTLVTSIKLPRATWPWPSKEVMWELDQFILIEIYISMP